MKRMWILLLLIAVTGSAHAQDRPNVVLMLVDNVGYGDLGAYGAGEIRGMPTPRIDQLASEGLRLSKEGAAHRRRDGCNHCASCSRANGL